MTWNWDLTLQTIGVASAVYFALRRNQRDQQKEKIAEAKEKIAEAERLARIEAILGVLHRWWEYKVERRSDADIQRYEEAKARKLKEQGNESPDHQR